MSELLNVNIPNHKLDSSYFDQAIDPSLLNVDLGFLDYNQDTINNSLIQNNGIISGTTVRPFDWNNAVTGGVGIVNGATGIINNVMNASRTHENPVYNSRLAEMRNAGVRNYSTTDQIANSMSSLNYGLKQDENVVRGMTTGQKIGNVGSSILSGAQAGSQFGWIGGVIGGVAGGLAGTAGILYGDSKARMQTKFDDLQGEFAQRGMFNTAQGEHERLMGNQHRDAVNHGIAARGGQIERKQMDIKDFAAKVLNQPRARVVRQKCKGGVMIKINR
jgi:hypothetical protein